MSILNKTGISDGGTIQATHVTNIYDALTSQGNWEIAATGSLTGTVSGSMSGSFRGSMSGSLTGTVSGSISGSILASKLDVIGNTATTGSVSISGSLTLHPTAANGLVITGSTTSELVRITQTGTGNALIVEDSANPDSTPFVIDNSGSVLIGTTSSAGIVTMKGTGAVGLALDTDNSSNIQSTRLFFKNSGSYKDVSLRALNGGFIVGLNASASWTSGTSSIYVSQSGDIGIGLGFTPGTRGAVLQVSGNISIESGFAYKQDNSTVIYIAKGSDTFYANTIGGADAGTSGSYRQTAFGNSAGSGNTGSYQTVFGFQAGLNNSGSNQTAVGVQAGQFNIGTWQTAIGTNAGYQNTGSLQTAVGVQAGYANSGSSQTAIGTSAGYQNIGSSQTAVGDRSGYYNTGSAQTAIGFQAGYANSGSNQTAAGYDAGRRNFGSSQTAVGTAAGFFNSGSNQTAVGVQAGYYNSGSGQTAVGVNAGYANSGSDNTNIGYNAGTYTNSSAVTINSQSAQSVFLGSQTNAGSGNRANQIVIGYGASGLGNNTVVLGNSSIAHTILRGNVGIGTSNTESAAYLLTVSGSTSTDLIHITQNGPGNAVRIDDAAGDTSPFVIDNSGSLGLGIIAPAAKIHINNTAGFDSLLVEDDTNPDATPFVIDSNGNVGIGTKTPTSKLHVNGSVQATSFTGSLQGTASNAATASMYAGRGSFTGTYTNTSAKLAVWTYTLTNVTSSGGIDYVFPISSSAVSVTATVTMFYYGAGQNVPSGIYADYTYGRCNVVTLTGIGWYDSSGMQILQTSSSLNNTAIPTICGLDTNGNDVRFFIQHASGYENNKIHVSLQFAPLMSALDNNGFFINSYN